ncbi:ABC transporter ATP-binding protein [Pseudomonas sp.]|uniref:ABC transporter ATP-binding protein n=1 Tax=Pseudomonas sp. TaxID=306 RepID=UPI00272D7867|nr:ABC transporter ATP-binding protein [Pseudomonas sp.]
MNTRLSAQHSAPVLDVQDLHYRYGDQPILQGLSFHLHSGEALCLLGHNGVGKTTALNHLLGFLKPASGQVRVTGLDPAANPSGVLSRIGYVPENAALYGHLDAAENIDYFLALADLPALPKAQLETHLQSVGFPLERLQQPASGYSKGMRQKVVLALALAKQAQVLLLDEPTTGLDPQSATELTRRIHELKAAGAGVLIVTHDLPWAQATADWLGIMEGGRITDLLPTRELTPAQLAERVFAGAANRSGVA